MFWGIELPWQRLALRLLQPGIMEPAHTTATMPTSTGLTCTTLLLLLVHVISVHLGTQPVAPVNKHLTDHCGEKHNGNQLCHQRGGCKHGTCSNSLLPFNVERATSVSLAVSSKLCIPLPTVFPMGPSIPPQGRDCDGTADRWLW